ncbi:hypothetical protein LLE70_07200 [Xanthomonas campestris pv. aberrans]|nr:hypothetical protein [Xanthomonas campestris pv. aberrans]
MADGLLERPGDCVLVERGVPRSLVMRCPDGCGEIITVNLDPRASKAWRFYRHRNQVSLFPSVWRDTGCGSHFIVWNHVIIWCDFRDRPRHAYVDDVPVLREKILGVLGSQWRHYWDIAQDLDEVPWDVNYVCETMAQNGGPLIAGKRDLNGCFKISDL